MNEMIYLYDGSFEGLLCCIFDSYANKEILTAIFSDEDFAPTLFPTRTVSTDAGHASRVLRKIHKLSPYAEELLRRGYICNLSHGVTLRLLPPLTIDQADLDGFVRVLEDVLRAN